MSPPSEKPAPGPAFGVLGTPLAATDYPALIGFCQRAARADGCLSLEFANTHLIALRRHDPEFARLTSVTGHFIPDGLPLIWCLNRQGAKLADRVYGPTFLRQCLSASPRPFTHYFLGGSPELGGRLRAAAMALNPEIQIAGSFHGGCDRNGVLGAGADGKIVAEINALSPDFIWVGLGTPKQQAWIYEHKAQLRRGVILSVGFAFDVLAGMKPDAPPAWQRFGLTWLFRLLSEPRRLAGRYLKYNSLFLAYLLADGVRGRAFAKALPPGKSS